MKHKFVTTSGRTVLYDPSTNGLFDGSGLQLNYSAEQFESALKWADTYGSLQKSSSPQTIKISLGQACNYSCGYCLQKDIGDPSERPSNGLTPMLIANIRRHLDLSELTRFELWGGETFLYWKDMVQLFDEFDRPGITWYIPTNGTPLQHKHIDKLLSLKGTTTIGISHDGPAHEQTRGPEFLPKKVDILRRIQYEGAGQIQYGFNPVISRTNYDLFEIDRFFSDFLAKSSLRPVGLSFELGRTYDSTLSVNSTDHVIRDDDIRSYEQILRKFLAEHTAQFLGRGTMRPLLPTNLFHLGVGSLELATALRHATPSIVKTNCGVDDKTLLTLDMLGNVRTCQNADAEHNAGPLMDIKGIQIKHVNLKRDNHCDPCPVKRLCKSSCPIDTGPAFFVNCALEKVHYRVLLEAALELIFGEAVTLHQP